MAQCVQISSLNLAAFCKLFAGYDSIKFATSFLFSSQTLFLSLLHFPFFRPSFFFIFSGTYGRNHSFSFSIPVQWIPSHSFLLGKDTANELTTQDGLLQSSIVPRSFSLFLTLISTHLFSRARGIVFYENSSMHRSLRSRRCFGSS